VNIQSDYDLFDLNTFQLHARARYFVELNSVEEIPELIQFAKDKKVPVRFLGGGSNLILPTAIDALVIKNNLSGVKINSENAQTVLVSCASGFSWHLFVMAMLDQGYYGLENLALIPGTVGGAPIQNIGAYGVEVNRFITLVKGYDFETGTVKTLSNSECQFDYRHSIFKTPAYRNFLVTEVEFQLLKQAQPVIIYAELAQAFQGKNPTALEVANKVIEVRSNKLPNVDDIPNVGSFFKNPIVTASHLETLKRTTADLVSYPQPNGQFKLAAGQLIDKLGFKGAKLGTVGMYAKQALVMVNHGQGQVADVKALVQKIQAECQSKFGVALEVEPIFW
jgi:UDP-N-acetylmuramate dehydrogenase